MGYFANALVFNSAPDFGALVAMNPDRFARGYQHVSKPFWLLDFWLPRGTIRRRVGPFCDLAFGRGVFTQAVLGPESIPPVNSYQSVCNAIGPPADIELEYIYFAVAASRRTDIDIHCFAADDEELDVGVNASQGILRSFEIRRDCISFVYREGIVTVTPINVFYEDQANELDRIVARLSALESVRIAETRDGADGQQLFENPVGLWPSQHGTAEEILGLGTWDPLVNLENEFQVVFEYEPDR